MSKDFENNDTNREPGNFGLPEGYFEKSAGEIFNRIEWAEEHKEFPRLSALKKESGFIVPENYFEHSEAKLELSAYPVLLNQNKKAGFVIPENYFEELEVNELSKVLADSENELQHFEKLSAIQKQNAFSVTGNYFSESEQRITSALTGNKQTKVIKLFGNKTWYMTAAAVLTITFGLWIYNQYFKIEEVKDCGTLACVDKIDLVKANKEYLDEDQLYKTINAEKLEEKLKNKDNNSNGNITDSTNKPSTEDILDEM